MTDTQFLRMLASCSFMKPENSERLRNIARALESFAETLSLDERVKTVVKEGTVS